MAKHTTDVLSLARLGAKVRLTELANEMRGLMARFPELGSTEIPAQVPASTPAQRTRRKMGAASRKAISLRMKAYWADRRKQKRAK